MQEIKNTTYKGTRILVGNEKRQLINKIVDVLIAEGFTEISIPIIQYQEMFADKVGDENNNMMFKFQDAGKRNICLAPEYTAVIQQLATDYEYKYKKDVKLFYVQECFRGEKPQAGRYRQFTQLGVEILNPTTDQTIYLAELAFRILTPVSTATYDINYNAKRGLDYYKDGVGFEISCEARGAQKQICGGGIYFI